MAFGDDFFAAVLGGRKPPPPPKPSRPKRPRPPVLVFEPGPVTPPAPKPTRPKTTPLTFTPGPVTPPVAKPERPETTAIPIFIPRVVEEHPDVEVTSEASLVVNEQDAEEILEAAEEGDDGAIVVGIRRH